MKVCFLSSAHPATDKRVFDKEGRALHEAGFEVVHLCPQSGNEPVGCWEQDGIQIETYPRSSGLRGRLFQWRSVLRRARAIKADIYHCNEVDSWLLGVLLRLTTGRLCVFDVHEHYPSTFAESRFPNWARPLVSSSIRGFYWLLTPFTAKIVLAKRSVAPDFWFAKKKLVLVQNFARLSALQAQAGEHGDRVSAEVTPAAPVMIHIGVFSRMRGWPQLLDAMARSKCQNAKLRVVGEINDSTEAQFFARAEELGLRDRVHLDRWMPFDQVFQALLASDVGLVLFQPGVQNHVFALPHKMFDYMLAELPVVAPHFAIEVREIIEESDCGILVDPADPQNIAAALDRLLCDPEERARLGRNGKNAVIARYNWDREAETLVAAYRELESMR